MKVAAREATEREDSADASDTEEEEATDAADTEKADRREAETADNWDEAIALLVETAAMRVEGVAKILSLPVAEVARLRHEEVSKQPHARETTSVNSRRGAGNHSRCRGGRDHRRGHNGGNSRRVARAEHELVG